MVLAIILIIAAFIVGYFVGSNNPYPAAKKKILDKAKNLIPIVLAIICLSSCSNHYNNKITGRGIAQSCNFSPITDSVQKLISEGMVSVDASHAGNPLVCDSVYTVKKTLWQNSKDLWGSWRGVTFVLGLVILIGLIVWFILLTSSGEDRPATLAIPIAAILVGGSLIGSSYFAFSDEREIKKIDYVHYIQTDGDLHSFWSVPVKSY